MAMEMYRLKKKRSELNVYCELSKNYPEGATFPVVLLSPSSSRLWRQGRDLTGNGMVLTSPVNRKDSLIVR